MSVPPVVGERVIDFDVLAPVDLDIRHAGLDESAAEETALPERSPAIGVAYIPGLAREVERGDPFRRGQEREGPLLKLVPHLMAAGIRVAAKAVDRLEERLAIGQPGRGQAIREFEAGEFELPRLGTPDHERVVPPTPGTSAISLERSDPITNRAAGQGDEPRQPIVTALACHDRPEVGWIDLGRSGRSRQADRPGLAMAAVEVDVAPDQRELVRAVRQFREDLREPHAGSSRGDRRERAAVFGGGIGLGVDEVEVARPASQPDQEDRPGPRSLGRGNLGQ